MSPAAHLQSPKGIDPLLKPRACILYFLECNEHSDLHSIRTRSTRLKFDMYQRTFILAAFTKSRSDVQGPLGGRPAHHQAWKPCTKRPSRSWWMCSTRQARRHLQTQAAWDYDLCHPSQGEPTAQEVQAKATITGVPPSRPWAHRDSLPRPCEGTTRGPTRQDTVSNRCSPRDRGAGAGQDLDPRGGCRPGKCMQHRRCVQEKDDQPPRLARATTQTAGAHGWIEGWPTRPGRSATGGRPRLRGGRHSSSRSREVEASTGPAAGGPLSH